MPEDGSEKRRSSSMKKLWSGKRASTIGAKEGERISKGSGHSSPRELDREDNIAFASAASSSSAAAASAAARRPSSSVMFADDDALPPDSPVSGRKGATVGEKLGTRISGMLKGRNKSVINSPEQSNSSPASIRKDDKSKLNFRRQSASQIGLASIGTGTDTDDGGGSLFFVGGGDMTASPSPMHPPPGVKRDTGGSGSGGIGNVGGGSGGGGPGSSGSGGISNVAHGSPVHIPKDSVAGSKEGFAMAAAANIGRSPKVAPKTKKTKLGLLNRSKNSKTDNSPFSKEREGSLFLSSSHFEGTPVVSGNFQEYEMGGAVAAASSFGTDVAADNMVRLEGIPGGIVKQVLSSENMLGVISQTGDLYVAASSKLHFSASGQPAPEGGSSVIHRSLEPYRLVRVKGMGALRRVALGDYHSIAISEAGELFVWGMNVNDPRFLTQDPSNGKSIQSVLAGQLGLGGLQYRFANQPIKLAGVPGSPIDVAVGSSHTVVLTDEGLYTCGNAMAVGRPDSFVFDVLTVVPSLIGIEISAIACGADHTLAVARIAGMVFTWGLNDHGQLGQPRQCKYAPEPTLVAGSKNILAVVAGPQHSVCVNASGYVIVWGSNVHGELGIGSDDQRVFEPQLVGSPLADEHTVILASCSRHCTFLVTDAGEVFQAGRFAAVSSSEARIFRRVPIEAKYVGGVAVGASHVVYLIDQALTHIMAQLMEPRTSSPEAFVRKLLRLFQVAVNNDSAELINGVQSRVNRLAAEQFGLPRIQVDQTVLSCVLQPGEKRSATHIIRVVNKSAFRVEFNCWWSLASEKKDFVDFSFSPATFSMDENESVFVRLEVTLLDESHTSGAIQTLCQMSARRLRKKSAAKSGSSGGFASHFFFLDVALSEKDHERDPALVQHLVETMSTYVPRLILRELQLNPAPPSGPTKVSFPGAVLFIDISGFTALNARLSKLGPAGPEQVSTHLNRYFGQLIDAVHQHGGDVLKFAGDALICLFGTPEKKEPLETLVLRAVQCGVMIQRDLAEYDSQQGFRLRIHIGVGGGDIHWLYLGGVNSHYEHVIMGDPMLQLETAVEVSKAGEVAVSADAHKLIADQVVSEARGKDNFLVTRVEKEIPPTELAAPTALPGMEGGLRCFLPPSVLARIDALHMSWLAELRRVTVIFVNLTSLTYERSQEVQLAAINEVLCSMQKIVFRYEGMVRQFIVDDKGTVLIAAFGVPPFGHEDDPGRGIKTAWEIHQKLLESNVTSCIGVTTGKVFCGSVGSSKRQEYAMVGDIVNLSARLMVVAKQKGVGIVVDETTRENTADLMTYENLEAVLVKGRAEPVAIAKPTGIKEQVVDHHSHQSLPNILDESEKSSVAQASVMPEIPMVGRKAEMGLLQLQVAKLQAMKKSARDARGSTKTFLLSGLAGMGKTRIINELARLCRKQNVEYYIGQCDALEKTKPFFVFQTILEQLINLELWKQRRNQKMEDVELATSMAEHWQANNSSVAAAFGIEANSNWAEYLPLLNNVLPLGLPDNEMCSKLDMEKRHMLTVSFMSYLIQARALQKPVVLIVEDLQWIDASSMQLLAAVAAETSANTKGILIVLSQRSPPQHPHYKQLLQLTGVEELKLVPLGDSDCRQIACSTLGVELSEWLPALDKPLLKAHGNPLFAMEIAYSLRESKVVDVQNGKLVLNAQMESAGIEIPETVEGMIGSRIDQLPSGPQLLLKVASVIGMEFTVSIVTAIFPIASQRNTISASLKELVEVGLLERTGGSPVYRFKNDTVRDVTYMRMLFTQRQQLHEKIALYYEEQRATGGSSGDRQSLLALAHHWRLAILNNNSPEATHSTNLTRLISYVMSAATLLQEEENFEEALRSLTDAEKMTDMMDGEDKIMLKQACIRQKAAVEKARDRKGDKI